MGKLNEIARGIVLAFAYILPVVFIIFFCYAIYIKITKNRVFDTQNDMIVFTRNVHSRYHLSTYKSFDTDFVSLSEYLPMDVKINKTEHGNEIINRFGGKMIFKESPKTIAERNEFRYISKERKMFEARYRGLGAFIVFFTELQSMECTILAATDWKAVIPSFLGLEISRVSKRHPFNGYENLDFDLLEDNAEEEKEEKNKEEENKEGEKKERRDKGKIFRDSLSYGEAWTACSCFGNKCQVALKFK